MKANIAKIPINMCTGCGACENICPNCAILLSENTEGFLYPVINKNKCSNCGLCIQNCSAQDSKDKHEITRGYIAFTDVKRIYDESTSGGMFALAAERFIAEKKGYVCGAAFDEEMRVVHRLTNKCRDIRTMQGSKYVQSYMGNIYQKVRRILKNGQSVLFCGTPCQVGGIKKHSQKHQEKLYTMDLICHGVPSPRLLKKYIDEELQQNNKHIEDLSFRTKDRYEKYGYNIVAKYSDGTNKFTIGILDPFMKLFLSNGIYRESCYKCKFANRFRQGDLTIGDCGCSMDYYKKYPGKTLSFISINNDKGQELWNSINRYCVFTISDIEKEIYINKQLSAPPERPSWRNSIYNDMSRMSIKELNKKYCDRTNFYMSIKCRLKRIMPEQLRLDSQLLVRKLFGISK
jgi:coenzyme F420-reducing hydrogenase beta subunit